jgi:hypothetical protein
MFRLINFLSVSNVENVDEKAKQVFVKFTETYVRKFEFGQKIKQYINKRKTFTIDSFSIGN